MRQLEDAARPPDEAARRAVAARIEKILRPRGAFARLDEIATWLAGWQRTKTPRIERPALLIFAADHGVAEERVSTAPPEITAELVRALHDGVATASAMARTLDATLHVVDIGVGKPTANIAREPAMNEQRFAMCFDRGRDAVPDTDLLLLGEIGIGNTTAAAALAGVIFDGPSETWTGRGTGVDDDGLQRKISVVERARTRVGSISPMGALREVGGCELVAIAGAITEARDRSIPVVLDGFVVTAAAAALEAARPGILGHCIAGHRSPEPGHAALLEILGMRPLLDLELALGEGSGALAALPLIKLAAAAVTDTATFDERGL